MSATHTKAEDKRQLLRHTVATIAYRGGKAVASVPDGFNSFRVNDRREHQNKSSRTSVISSIGVVARSW